MAEIKATFAFYKNSKSLFGRGIRIKQRFLDKEEYWKYSHVEFVTHDGTFYSSSEVDGGVRGKKIKDKKGNWDYFSITVTKEEYETIKNFFQGNIGSDYDRVGILFAQLFKTMWFLHPEKYFCSEICTESLQAIGKLCGITAYSVSPARFRSLLETL